MEYCESGNFEVAKNSLFPENERAVNLSKYRENKENSESFAT